MDVARPLGKRGGYGEVFAGFSADQTPVAIKKLHLNAAEAAHRELRVAAELKSRKLTHVVPVLAAGEDADTGGYFIVMACADGKRLSAMRDTMTCTWPQMALSSNAHEKIPTVPHILTIARPRLG